MDIVSKLKAIEEGQFEIDKQMNETRKGIDNFVAWNAEHYPISKDEDLIGLQTLMTTKPPPEPPPYSYPQSDSWTDCSEEEMLSCPSEDYSTSDDEESSSSYEPGHASDDFFSDTESENDDPSDDDPSDDDAKLEHTEEVYSPDDDDEGSGFGTPPPITPPRPVSPSVYDRIQPPHLPPAAPQFNTHDIFSAFHITPTSRTQTSHTSKQPPPCHTNRKPQQHSNSTQYFFAQTHAHHRAQRRHRLYCGRSKRQRRHHNQQAPFSDSTEDSITVPPPPRALRKLSDPLCLSHSYSTENGRSASPQEKERKEGPPLANNEDSGAARRETPRRTRPLERPTPSQSHRKTRRKEGGSVVPAILSLLPFVISFFLILFYDEGTRHERESREESHNRVLNGKESPRGGVVPSAHWPWLVSRWNNPNTRFLLFRHKER